MENTLIKNIALLSWAAGTFEGEGTVTITRSGARGYTRPMVMLTSTDPEMVDVFNKRWPGRIYAHQPKGNSKIAHTWSLNVRPAIARFLSDISPFLRTERVKRKADLVLEDIGARIQGAKGADYLACRWSAARGLDEHARFSADWTMHGKSAGPKRNQRMLDEGKPDLVVAFPGGVGTSDMVSRALKADMRVITVGTASPAQSQP